jgi:hypothetical protein
LENSPDNREKLQAMELFKDTHLVKLELFSNATTIDSALNYIRDKQQEHKWLAMDSSGNDNNNNSDDDQLNTTVGRQTVFYRRKHKILFRYLNNEPVQNVIKQVQTFQTNYEP